MDRLNFVYTALKRSWSRREIVWQLGWKISAPFCLFYIFVILFVALFTRLGFQRDVINKITDMYQIGAESRTREVAK